MIAIRRLLAQRWLAALLCAAALLLRLLVPSGYMIGREHGRPTIELCSGVSRPMAVQGDMLGHGKNRDHGRAEMPCAFSGLSIAALDSVDPIRLAVLIAFVTALGLCPVAMPAIARRAHLRPPLRGPPILP